VVVEEVDQVDNLDTLAKNLPGVHTVQHHSHPMVANTEEEEVAVKDLMSMVVVVVVTE
jgi:hypothetical protein